MAKIVSEILDRHADLVTGGFTVVVEYKENVYYRGWQSLHYDSKEQAAKECYVGLVLPARIG